MDEQNTLDELDYKIIKLIANDAKISLLEVARICNMSGAAVHQRVQKMTANNILMGAHFSLNLDKMGYKVCTYALLRFSKDTDHNNISNKLIEIPEITECHLTINPHELFIKLYALNNHHLRAIIDKLNTLGVIETELQTSFGELFNRQISEFNK